MRPRKHACKGEGRGEGEEGERKAMNEEEEKKKEGERVKFSGLKSTLTPMDSFQYHSYPSSNKGGDGILPPRASEGGGEGTRSLVSLSGFAGTCVCELLLIKNTTD